MTDEHTDPFPALEAAVDKVFTMGADWPEIDGDQSMRQAIWVGFLVVAEACPCERHGDCILFERRLHCTRCKIVAYCETKAGIRIAEGEARTRLRRAALS